MKLINISSPCLKLFSNPLAYCGEHCYAKHQLVSPMQDIQNIQRDIDSGQSIFFCKVSKNICFPTKFWKHHDQQEYMERWMCKGCKCYWIKKYIEFFDIHLSI